MSVTCAPRARMEVNRGVEEGDRLVVDLDAVCADVLRNAAGLVCGDLGLADRVEQRGLAVVNVTHNDNDRIAGLKLLCLILVLVEQLLLDGNVNFLLDLAAHFLRNDRGGIVVDDLGDGRHDAELDEALDNVRCGALHAGSELADRDLVRDHDLDRDLLERRHLLLTLQAAHLLGLLLLALAGERLLTVVAVSVVAELFLAAAL